jgi:hypothetical protein
MLILRNTVLLAMSMLGAVERSPIYAAVSLAGFLGAGLLFGQLGNVLGGSHTSYAPNKTSAITDQSGNQRRWWILLTLSFQITVLGIAAFVISDHSSTALHVNESQAWVYVFLIGLQGGPQVTMVGRSAAGFLHPRPTCITPSWTLTPLGRQRRSPRTTYRHDDHSLRCFHIRP